MARGLSPRVVKTFRAEGGAIGAGYVVVWGTAEDQVKLPGGADAGAIVGITLTKADAAGDPLEVVVSGSADLYVKAASPTIAKGDVISIHGTTGSGKKAAPSAGVNTFLVGFAEEAASADDVQIAVGLSKSVMQGA